jgi:flagellar basal-body rod modification protein FlgD
MDVSSATSVTAQAPPKTTQAGGGPTVDYNAFLQLLIAQMKNQDPTSPQDPSAFMAQLASFSSVEQAMQTNAKLDAMLSSSALSQAESLIGRTITSADGLTSGKVLSVNVSSAGSTALLEDGKTLALGDGISVS